MWSRLQPRALALLSTSAVSIAQVSPFLAPAILLCVCQSPTLARSSGLPQRWVLGIWRLGHVWGSCFLTELTRLLWVTPLAPECQDMDLLQFLATFFVLLLTGTEVTGTVKTTVDPGLKICISLWRGWDV